MNGKTASPRPTDDGITAVYRRALGGHPAMYVFAFVSSFGVKCELRWIPGSESLAVATEVAGEWLPAVPLGDGWRCAANLEAAWITAETYAAWLM